MCFVAVHFLAASTHGEVIGEGGAWRDAALRHSLHAVVPLAAQLSDPVPAVHG